MHKLYFLLHRSCARSQAQAFLSGINFFNRPGYRSLEEFLEMGSRQLCYEAIVMGARSSLERTSMGKQKNLTLGALLSKSFSNLGYSMFVTGSLLAATITSAAAEGEKNPWTYWVGAGAHFFEADDAAETGALYEARVGYALNPNLELEVGLGGGPFYEGNDHNAPDPKEGTYNGYNSPGENWAVKSNFGALYHLDGSADKKLDPYVSAMAGMAYLGKQRDESQNWAPYAGPGFGVSYWFNPDFAVRADYSLLAWFARGYQP